MAKNDLRSTILTEHRQISASRYALAIINFIAVLVGTLVTLYFVGRRGAPNGVSVVLYILLGINVAQLALCLIDYAFKNFLGIYFKYLPIASYVVAGLWVILTIVELCLASAGGTINGVEYSGIFRTDLLGVTIIQFVVSLVAYLVWPMMDRMAIDAMTKQSVREDKEKRQKVAKSYVLRYALLCVFIVIAQVGSLIVYKLPPNLYDLFSDTRAVMYKESEEGYIVTGVYAGKSETVIIPAEYDNKPVVGIANNALADKMQKITKIVLGTATTDTAGNTVYESNLVAIGENAISNDYITELVIPESVTTLEKNAISGAKLTSLVLPESLKTIGESAIVCDALKELVIPEGVTTLAKNAITCSSLTKLEVLGTITAFGEGAITCESLKELSLSVNIEDSLGNNPLNCKALTDLTISGTINALAENAITGDSLQNVTLPESLTTIQAGAIKSNSLTKLTIPASVTTLEGDAINCSKLATLEFTGGITELVEGAVKGDALTQVILPESLTTIRAGAIQSTSLTEITIPQLVTAIESSAIKASALVTVHYYTDAKFELRYFENHQLEQVCIYNDEVKGVDAIDGIGSIQVKVSKDKYDDFRRKNMDSKENFTPMLAEDGIYVQFVTGCDNYVKTQFGSTTAPVVITMTTLDELMADTVMYRADKLTVETPEGGGANPGYVFRGWYYDEDFEDECIFSNDGSITLYDKKTTLYAKWTKQHTGTLNWGTHTPKADEGIVNWNGSSKAIYWADDKVIEFPLVTDRVGYSAGVAWEIDGEFATNSTGYSSDVVLNAVWTLDKLSIALESQFNNGTALNPGDDGVFDFTFNEGLELTFGVEKTHDIKTESYYSYSWTKVDSEIEYTLDSIHLANVSQSGTYNLTVTLTVPNAESVQATIKNIEVQINKKDIEVGTFEFNDEETTYNSYSQPRQVSLAGLITQNVEYVLTYTKDGTAYNGSLVNAGVYGVNLTVSKKVTDKDYENYNSETFTATYTILPHQLQFVEWKGKGEGWDGSSIIYDATEKAYEMIVTGVLGTDVVNVVYDETDSGRATTKGTYRVAAVGVDNSNYTIDGITVRQASWSIKSREIRVSGWKNSWGTEENSVVYNGKEQIVSAELEGVIGNDDVALVYSQDAMNKGTNVGSYVSKVERVDVSNPNYVFVNDSDKNIYEWKITKRTLSVQYPTVDYTYNSQMQTVKVTVANIVSSELELFAGLGKDAFSLTGTTYADSNITWAGENFGNGQAFLSFGATNAGYYTISFANLADGTTEAYDFLANYTLESSEETYQIKARELTIRKADAVYTYTGTLQELPVIVSGIYVSDLAGFDLGMFTTDAVSGVVDDVNKNFKLVYKKTNAGDYAVGVSAFKYSNAEYPNYVLTNKFEDSITIEKKTLTLSQWNITDQTPGKKDAMVKLEKNASFIYNYHGYQVEDAVIDGVMSGDTVVLTYNNALQKNAQTTAYTTVAHLDADKYSNYQMEDVSINWYITPYELEFTWKVNGLTQATFVYDGENKTVTPVLVNSLLEDDELGEIQYLNTSSALTQIDVGNYNYTISKLGNTNYKLKTVETGENKHYYFAFEITKREVRIDWGTSLDSYTYSGNYQGPQFEVEGIVARDAGLMQIASKAYSSLKGNTSQDIFFTEGFSYTAGKGFAVDVGEYSIRNFTISKLTDGSYKVDGNYTVVADEFEFTITPKKIVLTGVWNFTNAVRGTDVYDNKSNLVYNTKSYTVTTSIDQSGIVERLGVFDVLTLVYDSNTQSNANDYVTKVTALNGTYATNYELVLTETTEKLNWTIERKVLNVNWTELEKTYNNKAQSPVASILMGATTDDDGFAYERVDISLEADTAKTAAHDNYLASVAVESMTNSNYVLNTSTISQTWVINPYVIDTLTWSERVFTYNAQNQSPVASYDIHGTTVYAVLDNTANRNVGTYTVTAQINTDNANYVLSENFTCEYQIVAKQITLNWAVDNATAQNVYTYDGEQHTLTATAVGVYEGDIVNLTYDDNVFKNAADYTVIVTAIDNTNYHLEDADNSWSFTVNKKVLTFSWLWDGDTTEKQFTYNENSRTLVAKLLGVANSDLGTVEPIYADNSMTSVINAGTYTVEVIGFNNANYTFDKTNVNDYKKSIVINKQQVTIAWSGLESFVYDGTSHITAVAVYGADNGKLIYTNDNFVSHKNVSDSNTFTLTQSYLDTYDSNNVNYTLVNPTSGSVSRTVTVSKKVVTVAWTVDHNITYDGKSHSAVAEFTNVCEGDTVNLTYKASRVSAYGSIASSSNNAINAGEYTISVASVSNNNYTMEGAENLSTTLLIAKQKVIVTWNENTTFTYNAKAQVPSVTVQGVSNDQSVSVTYTAPVGQTNVGSYVAEITALANDNYTLDGVANTSVNYTINPFVVTITWGTTTFTYNGTEQAPTPTVKGVNGNTISASSYTVGGKKINAGLDYLAEVKDLTDANYTLDGATNKTVNFVINKQAVKITWTNTTFTYNGLAQRPTPTVVGSINTTTNVPFEMTSPEINAGVGYEARITALTNENYTLDGATNVSTSYTINPQAVSIKWSNLTVTYNGKAQIPTAEVAGKNDQIAVAWDLVIANDKQLVNADSYTLQVQLNNNNYTLSGVSNTSVIYTINPQMVEITWTETTTFTYNGLAQAPTATVKGVSDGKIVAFSATEAKTDAGSNYNVTVTLNDTNYTLSGVNNKTVYYTILPKTVDIAWSNVTTFEYNGQAQIPSVSVTGLNGVAINYVISQGKVNVGQGYTATITSLTNATNYTLSGANASITYSIVAQEVTIEWDSITTFVYDGTQKAPTATVKGATDGKTVSHTVNGFATNVGSNYTATVSLNDTNYTLSGNANVEKAFEIVAQEVVIEWSNLTFIYDGTVKTPTVTVKGKTDSKTIAQYSISASGVNVGTHTATITNFSNSNYTIVGNANVSTEYVISAQEITSVEWSNLSFTYDGTTKVPTAIVKYNGNALSSNYYTVTVKTTETATNVGNYVAVVTLNTSNYVFAKNVEVEKAFEINTQEVVVTVGSTTFMYNGNAQVPSVTVKGKVDGKAVDFKALVGETNVGNYEATIELQNTNYTISEEDSKVSYQIVAKAITVSYTLPDGETADGTAKTVKVQAQGMVNGETVSYTITNEKGQVVTTVKDAGTYTVTVTVSSNYTITNETTRSFTINVAEEPEDEPEA